MNLAYVLAAVLAGVAYGMLDPHRLTGIVGPATLYVFLPLLLFEAAWNLNYRAIKRFWRPIATLAGPGVALTAIVVAGSLYLAGTPVAPALLAGAILSATDPIAVVAVFRRLRVPLALATIIECESLFNDAVAVVLYRAVLSTAGIWYASASGLLGSIAGTAIGIVVALLAASALRARTNATLQSIATVLCAYSAYFVAEHLGCSGLFATIACGIALRYYERSWVTLSIAEAVYACWGRGAFVANICVFFLVGAALDLREALAHPLFLIATLVGVVVARFAIALLLVPAKIPRTWFGVVRAAGLRGALSLALALALPPTVPYRSEIVAAAFIVALVTIATSGFTVPNAVARAMRPRRQTVLTSGMGAQAR